MTVLPLSVDHDRMPIGTCTHCRVPTYDLDDINSDCECGKGFICSVAENEWYPCPPCLASGRSLIWSNLHDRICPVCFGAGRIRRIEQDLELALSECEAVIRAITLAQHAPWPPAPERLLQSKLGSVSTLVDRWSPIELRVLAAAVDDLMRGAEQALEHQVEAEMEAETGPVMVRFMPQYDRDTRKSARRLAARLRRLSQDVPAGHRAEVR